MPSKRKPPLRPSPGSGEPTIARRDADVQGVYDELLKSRDRLAALPPLTRADHERADRAMHEVIWFLLTPPLGRKTTLPGDLQTPLLRAARNRDIDLYVRTVAIITAKLAVTAPAEVGPTAYDALTDILDGLTFDERRPKKATVAMLRDLKAELDARIAYVLNERIRSLPFDEPPETYRDRANKAETPDRFFRRVYGKHLARGLTQADIRKADPAFYNVFHVWCTRHRKRLATFVPTARLRRG